MSANPSHELREHVVGAQGQEITAQWRAEYVSGVLQWQVRRVYACAGFEETTPKTIMFHRVFPIQVDKLKPLLAHFGLPLRDHVGYPFDAARSRRAKHADVGEGALHWLSTQALLLQLLRWASTRQTPGDRERARLCLLVLARSCRGCDVGTCMGIADEHAAKCFQEVADSGYCRHLDRCMRTVHVTPEQDAIVHHMQELYKEVEACAACSSTLCSIVHAVAIDNCLRRADWQMGAHVQLSPLRAPTGKRRKLDPHERAEKRVHTAETGQNHQLQLMGSSMACLLMDAKSEMQAGIAFACAVDAGRIGKPSKDRQICWLTCLDRVVTVSLPPVVRLRNITHQQPPVPH
eukprot:6200517-Amphidinium_carterae.3